MNSLSKSFVKDNFFTLLSNIISYSKRLLIVPFYFHTIGIELYGSYSLLITFLGIIYGLSTFGIGYNAQRYLPSTDNISEKRNIFFRQFFFHFSSIIILSLILVLLNEYVRDRKSVV